jgi:hypothetical protein
VEIDAPAVAGSNTLVLPNGNGTNGQYLQTNGSGGLSWATVSTSNLTRGTEVSATGSSVVFSSIPAGVRRITLILDSVSLDGADNLLVQIGDSGGLETTGYVSRAQYMDNSTTGASTSTSGFLHWQSGSGFASRGAFVLVNMSGNKWVSTGITTNDSVTNLSSGVKTLSDTLTQIALDTTGTNSFDGGNINIFYEV